MPSWLPWSSSSSSNSSSIPSSSASKALREDVDKVKKTLEEDKAALIARLSSIPPHILGSSAFVAGLVFGLGAQYVYARYLRRIPNADWVTPDILARRRWIKGYVTSVGDADNFRLYHTPGIGWRWPLKFRRIPVGRDLKDQTIHIRMAGVDAPEAGHFGRPSQAFAEESLAWLKNQVENKFVYCQLVRRDQYGRIVAVPHLKPRLLPNSLATGKNLPLEMLRAGWGSVYEQAGAEYGPRGVEEFLRVQSEAQKARRGIWQRGTSGETPAEYKRRYREAATSGDPVAPPPASPQQKETSGGWFRRLFRLK
ncbi:SNase-domain-containing protein [Lentinus tigrinus ALCF2SS1-7]|uniref:SNase-domain-containing protein n=1 Tax=Lentinus tigrinus ALCF2SS1-6 TaxID=1328759 RepID=A0A5C2RR89_9APHY|nr:SNase-domain-containing protein [Lentinus tigrinus ALCF2SS1-6]RPD76799.1 SNase-domain-containing protein [Lentinus tigrinus ALCF2SS1-7]